MHEWSTVCKSIERVNMVNHLILILGLRFCESEEVQNCSNVSRHTEKLMSVWPSRKHLWFCSSISNTDGNFLSFILTGLRIVNMNEGELWKSELLETTSEQGKQTITVHSKSADFIVKIHPAYWIRFRWSMVVLIFMRTDSCSLWVQSKLWYKCRFSAFFVTEQQTSWDTALHDSSYAPVWFAQHWHTLL